MALSFYQLIPPVRNILTGGFILCLQAIFVSVLAEEVRVEPGKGLLQAAIDSSKVGDILLLSDGTYSGSIQIDKTLTLIGNLKSIIDAEGTGHAITISAPDVIVKGLRIQNSGKILETEDSAIFITDAGDRSRIESNVLENNLIGVFLKGPESVVVDKNVIIGSKNHRMNDRGNGVYLWNTPGSVIRNNDIQYGRDGIFVTNSTNNIFHANKMRDLRFAVHYMYTNNSEVTDNISINNHVGFALMFSDRILARGNSSQGDHERGLFFNFANYSIVEANRVSGGAKKCVFIYNANYNQINRNVFDGCDIGIHFTAGSDNNSIYENAFINNKSQVKYVGTRYIEWSKDGRGNYWSDNTAFDIDNNSIADQPYRPNDLVDQIVWRHPMAKLLLNSPSVQLIKWAQTEFPGLHPGGVTDSAPLMSPPYARPELPVSIQSELEPNG